MYVESYADINERDFALENIGDFCAVYELEYSFDPIHNKLYIDSNGNISSDTIQELWIDWCRWSIVNIL